MIQSFDFYCENGLKVIPLRPFSKKPFLFHWQDISRYDQETCRLIVDITPDSNIGVLLGDIVDVEGDDVDSNHFLNELIGDIPHPKYKSSKSVHHLFLNPDKNLTRLVIGKIEFRANRHQSVLPPSKHQDGTSYHWEEDSVFPIPEMPKLLQEFYKRHRPKEKPFGHKEMQCNICKKKIGINKKRLSLEMKACRAQGLLWSCNKCRNYDLRPACRKIKRSMGL